MRDGPNINLLKLAYANDRAADAFAWLREVGNTPIIIQVAENESDADHLGWYRFNSKGRKGKFHYTMPGASECTCEGWHPELVGKATRMGPCTHMFIVWLHEYVINKILPQFHPLDVPVEQQVEESEYQYAA